MINDYYLKKNILSFIRNHEYKRCDKCKKVCRWNNKKINLKHLEFNNEVKCYECFVDTFFKGLNIKIEKKKFINIL